MGSTTPDPKVMALSDLTLVEYCNETKLVLKELNVN